MKRQLPKDIAHSIKRFKDIDGSVAFRHAPVRLTKTTVSQLARILEAFGNLQREAQKEGGSLEEIVDRICQALSERDGSALKGATVGISAEAPAPFVEQCRDGSFSRWLRSTDEVLDRLNMLFRQAALERNLADAALLDGLRSVVVSLVHLKKFGLRNSRASLERMLTRTADALDLVGRQQSSHGISGAVAYSNRDRRSQGVTI
jgi:hypothetical protein